MGVRMDNCVRWTNWDGEGLDQCRLSKTEEGMDLEGLIVSPPKDGFAASYSVRTDSEFRTRDILINCIGGSHCSLVVNEGGCWFDRLAEVFIPELEGCLDLDISFTPATNSLPINRLCLGKGEAAEIKAAFLPPPTEGGVLSRPRPVMQRYTCLDPGRRYLYEGLESGFKAEIEVDDTGLVLGYPDSFRRVDLS